MPKVNPNILRWARETAGISIEEACRKLKLIDLKDIRCEARLTSYENGENIPSRTLLLKMAKVYHRSLVTFYLSVPPRKGNRGQDFRKLPQGYSREVDALADALIRDILARQGIIRSALEDEEETKKLLFVKSMRVDDGIRTISESIKKTLGFKLEEFRRQFSPQDAFLYLRTCAENSGIFVLLIGDLGSHHTDIGLEIFRGFALADDIAPFIIINDQDSKTAWSFTLMHEIAHIWLGQTGISNWDFDNETEKICNDIASDFLLPQEELSQLHIDNNLDFDDISLRINEFANKRNLSCSMVAYKLYRADKISQGIWYRLYQRYQGLWYEARNKIKLEAHLKKGGPNYYTVRRYLLGQNLLSVVQRMMAGGILTTTKAGKVLGIKAKNVHKLFEVNGPSKSGQLH